MKQIKRPLTIFLVTLLFLVIPAFICRGDSNAAENKDKALSIFSDRYIYQCDTLPSDEFLTFEAVIKISSSTGDSLVSGVIFSDMGYTNTFGVSVAKKGVLTLEFGGTHSFPEYDLRTGEWTHIALTYDKESDTLSYYVNGLLKATKKVEIDASKAENRKFFVGTDWYSWTKDKTPFKGSIKQITLYSSPISANTVSSDAKSTEIKSEDRKGLGLIANWDFTESWASLESVTDSSGNNNAAYLGTYDKYVPVKDTSVASDGTYDYAIAVIPDIQAMTYTSHKNLTQLSNWLVTNKNKYNIQFTMYLGDLVESKYVNDPVKSKSEWEFMTRQLFLLDGKMPYTFVPGNHDYDDWASGSRSLTNFNKYFSYEKYSSLEYFGGAFEEGHLENVYYIFDVGEIEYLVFALEYTPRYNVFNWVDRIISEHPDKRVIITTHAVLNTTGEFDTASKASGKETRNFEYGWEILKKHSNIMLIFGGHNGWDWLENKTLIGDNGNIVHTYLVDLQGAMMTSRMNTFLLIKVNEKDKTMSFCYYSPEMNKCFNDQNQFVISFADPKNPCVGGVTND